MNPNNFPSMMPPPLPPVQGGDHNDNSDLPISLSNDDGSGGRPAKKTRTTNTDDNIPISVSNDDDAGQPPLANNYASGGLEHGATAEVASAATTDGSTGFNFAAIMPADAGDPNFMTEVEQTHPSRVLASEVGFVGNVMLIAHNKTNDRGTNFFSHDIHFTNDESGVVTRFTKREWRYGDAYFMDGIVYACNNGYAKEGDMDLGPLVPEEYKQAADLANFPAGEVAIITKPTTTEGRGYRGTTRVLHLKQGIISNSILDFCSKTNIDNNLIHTSEILRQRLNAGRNGFNFKGGDPTLMKTREGSRYEIYLPGRNEVYKSILKAHDAAKIIQQDLLRAAVREVLQSRNESPGGRNCTFRQQWVEDWDISYTRDALRYWVKEGSNAFMAYSIAKCLIKHLHRTVTDDDYRTNERLAGLMLCILRNHAVGDFASEIDGLLNLLNPAFIVNEEDTTPALAFNRQAAPDDQSVEGDDVSLDSLTVEKLKEECKERGLKGGGKKAEIIQRIKDHDAAKEKTVEEPSVAAKSEKPVDDDDKDGENDDAGVVSVVKPDTIVIARAQSLKYPEGSRVFEEAENGDLVLVHFDGIGIVDTENVIALKGYKDENGEPEAWLIFAGEVRNNIFVITSPGPNSEPVFYDEMEEDLDHLEELLEALEGSSGGAEALEGVSGGAEALEGSSGGAEALEGSSGGAEALEGSSGGAEALEGSSGGAEALEGVSGGAEALEGSSGGAEALEGSSGGAEALEGHTEV